MAPNASVDSIATQTKMLVRSAHSSVGSRLEMTMSTPPMVGVPPFFRWVCGPSSRTYWPKWNSRRRSMTNGPMSRPINNAVSEAKTVRKVR